MAKKDKRTPAVPKKLEHMDLSAPVGADTNPSLLPTNIPRSNKMEISAKVGKDGSGPHAKINYNMPATLADAVTAFGEDVVYNKAIGAITIDIQAGMRRQLVDTVNKEGKVTTPAKSQDEIQAWADSYKPEGGTRGVKQSALEKATSAVEKMTPEERKALLAKLQGLS